MVGGLQTVQLTVNDVTKSRFNGLGKAAKNLKLFVQHAYSINAIYLGNECRAQELLLEAPHAYDVMENSLSFCRELRSFTLVAPKIEFMGHTIQIKNMWPYTLKLLDLMPLYQFCFVKPIKGISVLSIIWRIHLWSWL